MEQRKVVQIIKKNPEDSYEIGHKLGEGGQAIVYSAKNKETGEDFALKQILIQNDAHKEKIIDEIAISRLSEHKNIIKFYETYEHNFSLWIVEELMVCSLKEAVAGMGGGLEEKYIGFILQAVCSGLLIMHTNGRIHRDVKCENVLISRDGEIKLADLGCAAQLVQEQSNRHTIIGTPYYMAPELALGNEYNEKVDIWGVGILGYYLAEGETPYHRLPINEILNQIISGSSPRLKNPEKWSANFNDFLQACLVKDPESRPLISSLLYHSFIQNIDPNIKQEFLSFLLTLNAEDSDD
jgi:serine/threonine protein kinase